MDAAANVLPYGLGRLAKPIKQWAQNMPLRGLSSEVIDNADMIIKNNAGDLNKTIAQLDELAMPTNVRKQVYGMIKDEVYEQSAKIAKTNPAGSAQLRTYADDFIMPKETRVARPTISAPSVELKGLEQPGKLVSALDAVRSGVLDDLTVLKKAFKGQVDEVSGMKVPDSIDEMAGSVRRSDSISEAELRGNAGWQELRELLTNKKEAKDIAAFISKKQDVINKAKFAQNQLVKAQDDLKSVLNRKNTPERFIEAARRRVEQAEKNLTEIQKIDIPVGTARQEQGYRANV